MDYINGAMKQILQKIERANIDANIDVHLRQKERDEIIDGVLEAVPDYDNSTPYAGASVQL